MASSRLGHPRLCDDALCGAPFVPHLEQHIDATFYHTLGMGMRIRISRKASPWIDARLGGRFVGITATYQCHPFCVDLAGDDGLGPIATCHSLFAVWVRFGVDPSATLVLCTDEWAGAARFGFIADDW